MAKRRKYKFTPPQLDTLGRGNRDLADVMMARVWGTTNSSLGSVITAIIEWDQHMARKTYRLELKIDFNDDSNHEIMLGIAKQYARDLLASAMLLQDGRKPAVALMTDDSFTGVDEISIIEPSQDLHT